MWLMPSQMTPVKSYNVTQMTQIVYQWATLLDLIDIVKITHSSFGGAYKVGLHWVNKQDEFGTWSTKCQVCKVGDR